MVFPAVFNVSSLNGKNGFTFNDTLSSFGSNSGWSVSGAGDINADGIDDIIMDLPSENEWALSYVVLFGSKYEFPATINSTWLNGQNGFVINGYNNRKSSLGSRTVSAAGDINADGIDDIIIGDSNTSPKGSMADVGQSYVIFGSKTEFPPQFNLTSLNGKNGFTINGINANDGSGDSVSGAGDVNADGISDIVIGAPWANNGVGEGYVVFGSKIEFPAMINSTWLNVQNGFVISSDISVSMIDGCGIGPTCGRSISVDGAGDINNDGIDDIIMGVDIFGINVGGGQSYIIFGQSSF